MLKLGTCSCLMLVDFQGLWKCADTFHQTMQESCFLAPFDASELAL